MNQTSDEGISYFSQEMLDFLWVMIDGFLIESGIIWFLGAFYLLLFIVLWRERRRKKRQKIYRQNTFKH